MPYLHICKTDPDDGKLHDMKNKTHTKCGKPYSGTIISGLGTFHSVKDCCVICFPMFKENHTTEEMNSQGLNMQ
jgi:hypothetical protein